MDTTHRDPKDVADNKDLAALGYVWILSLVVLFAKRESAFAQFHARQGATLFGLSLVVWAMPFVGKLAELLVLALCLIGFIHAAQGEWREVPVVGPLSRGSIADVRKSWKDVVAAVSALWNRVRGTSSPDGKTEDATPHPAPATPPVIDVPASDPVHAESPIAHDDASMPRAFTDVPPAETPAMSDAPAEPSSDPSSPQNHGL